MIGAGGLFAPTMRYYHGTFYIVCTNVGEEGEGFQAENFLISTSDIWSDQWSDPIKLELHGIDPSLFIADGGTAYLQGSFRLERTEQPTSTIKQYQIDLETGRRLSEIVEIWPGYSKVYTEGPHIDKKDGYHYLLVAEGRRSTTSGSGSCRRSSKSCLLTLIGFCPESPRWLVANGKEEKARQFLTKHHGEGNPNNSPVC